MRVSKETKLAFDVLKMLAQTTVGVSFREICDWFPSVSAYRLQRVVKALVGADIMAKTGQARHARYALNVPLKKLRVWAIVEAVEGSETQPELRRIEAAIMLDYTFGQYMD